MPTEKFPGLVPADWVRAADVFLDFRERHCDDSPSPRQGRKRSHNQRLADWLTEECQLGDPVSHSVISTLRNAARQEARFQIGNNREAKALKGIQENVPVTAVLKHLSALRYRSGAYHDHDLKRRDELEGIYIAKRLSFAVPGKVNISAFRFQRDSQNRPFYKEKRVIKAPGKRYQVRTRGSWFMDRGAYSLIGLSYELKDTARETGATIANIGEIYEDRIVLDNDANQNILRGVIASVVKEEKAPTVTEIFLQRLELDEGIDAGDYWGAIEQQTNICGSGEKIGIRSATEEELDTLPIRASDRNYLFPLIKTRR